MRISLYESKKALTSPIILFLLVLFTVYNIFLIYNSSDFKKELHIANDIAKNYGLDITDESLLKLENDMQEDLSYLNEITSEKVGQTFTSSGEFFTNLRFEDQETYTEEQLNSFYDLYVKEMYLGTAKGIDDSYNKIDIATLGEDGIRSYGLTGSAADTLRKQFEVFEDRFEQMKANAEHKEWFFAGKMYFMHSLLFKSLFLSIILESIILIVLSTALITNYEFENRTQLVTFATKRGRRLMGDKLSASLIVSTFLSVFLLGSSLFIYFIVYDYSHLWGSSISSAFNWEYQFPYVSWWDMSLLTFLIWSIALFYACMLLFAGATFVISVLIKNSYFTFFVFAAIFAILFLLQGFMPKSSNLLFAAGFNLSSLALNPHQWFMASKGLLIFKYYEWITVLVWMVFITVFIILVIKHFKKREIV
ncbi:hypothetical protein [Paucisalibacillus sp. EB02]|uniref:hypothetical protein n=1 Tax=Paucisalibacillus sp. EB02 TaxID=1347087 RepID=UPI0005AB5227|nr:hypothetical protein [Paucisalibacillus sp. EB02]